MDRQHTLKRFDQDMDELKKLVLELGALARTQLGDALRALSEKDEALAARVVADDERVNALERSVDRASLLLVTRMEPKAGDLRHILACGKIASDLERIADYAKNVAGRSGRCMSPDFRCKLAAVDTMGAGVMAMLRDVLDAYSRLDVEQALEVWHADAGIDSVFKAALSDMKDCVQGEDIDGKGFISLVFIMRCLERVGDHITNIAEHIYFIKYGDYYSGRK